MFTSVAVYFLLPFSLYLQPQVLLDSLVQMRGNFCFHCLAYADPLSIFLCSPPLPPLFCSPLSWMCPVKEILNGIPPWEFSFLLGLKFLVFNWALSQFSVPSKGRATYRTKGEM